VTAVTNAPKHVVSVPVRRWAQLMASQNNAGQAVGDRLVTAAVGLIGAVVGAVVALFARDTTVAVLVGLVTLCVTPGCALVCWLTTRERLTRAIAVLAASLTWTILATSVLAWLRVTALGVLLAATVGVGGVGSALFLLSRLGLYRKRLPDVASVDQGEDASEHKAVQASLNRPGVTTASVRSLVPQLLLTITLVAAAGLFAFSVLRAHGHVVGSYGLLPLLGIPFYAATVLTIGVLVVALRFVRPKWPAAAVALGLLLVEFNGTPMMLDATPLSSWTYKHFGVVDYIVHGGALKDPLDIYQQWPGFFAAAAGLVHLSGREPLSYANWAQLFFQALNAVVIFAIARRFSQGRQVVPYVTVLLFETAAWEGQFYFSPQTTAFLLTLLFQFFLLPLLEPARVRSWFKRRRWLRLSVPLDIEGEKRPGAVGTAVRVVGLVAVFGAGVITHQLSPCIIFVGVAALWVLGVLRRLPVVLALAIALVGYTLLHLPAVDHNQLFTGFSLSNATGKPGLSPPTQEQALAAIPSKAIGLALWGTATVCVLSYGRRLGVIAIPAVLAAVPFLFILGTNYEGEAIYRVFLFSSPWCALIIAIRLGTLVRVPVPWLTAVGAWAVFAALGSAQAQDFGMYPMLYVPPGEIAASAYFLDHAPPKSMLVQVGANFPSRVNGNYVLHNVTQTQNDPSLDSLPELEGNGINQTSPEKLAQIVAYLAEGTGYLVVAPSMYPYADYYGSLTRGALSALVPRLKESPYWQVWYANGGTTIFRAWPQGRPKDKAGVRRPRTETRRGYATEMGRND
jgi:hypothetical protein